MGGVLETQLLTIQQPIANAYHLTASSATTRNKFPHKLDPPSLWVHCPGSDEGVHRQFDGFLRSNTLPRTISTSRRTHVHITNDQLRTKTTVKPKEAFIVKNLPDTIHAVLVKQLADYGASLVLHAGLYWYKGEHLIIFRPAHRTTLTTTKRQSL